LAGEESIFREAVCLLIKIRTIKQKLLLIKILATEFCRFYKTDPSPGAQDDKKKKVMAK
jgi:hypothetical protein